MFDDFIALLWQSKEIVLIILAALLLFIILAVVARISG
jgi:hypothetical protein